MLRLKAFLFFSQSQATITGIRIYVSPPGGEGVFGRTQYPLAALALANLEYIRGGVNLKKVLIKTDKMLLET